MKDLDFDELDKAVNSLMAGVPKTPDSSDNNEKMLTISSSEQPSALPAAAPAVQSSSLSNPQIPASPAASPAPRPTAAPASRRAGRFMDVVRPQAPPKKQEVPAKVSRQGVSLDPVTPTVKPEPTSVSSPAPVSDVSVKPKEATQGDWPDPLDMAGFSPSSVDSSDESKKAPSLPASETADADASPESPLLSPFLPDTKVEKRPLGANAVAHAGIADPADSKPEEQPVQDAGDEQLPATLEDTKSILPEELHSDLVAIESDTTSPDKAGIKQESSVSWKAPEEIDAPKREASAPEPSKPSIPISIPQQYKEEASTGEQENGAIYDTDTYHKPLTHPAKQKSGWMWVIWILLILIVGAGGGAALYFLRLV